MSFYIIIRGPLGCGKSAIAEKLSKILKAKYIAIDRVLDEYDLAKDIEDGYISERSFLKANKIIAPKVRYFLQKGQPVIIDGNFYRKSQIEDLIKRLDFPERPKLICRSVSILHYVFTLKAPLEICIERDNKRGKTHGEEATRAVYKKATEFDYGIIIDANRNLQECIEEILSCLPK